VALYARWCLIQVFRRNESIAKNPESPAKPTVQTLNPEDKSLHLELSSDLFSASNTTSTSGYQSVRATLPVSSSGVQFYEAILCSDGCMQIGWATKECIFKDTNAHGVGDYVNSIGFDGKFCKIWNGGYTMIDDMPAWKTGDVVGCLIDVPKRHFVFYLNGKQYDPSAYGLNVLFSDQPYYPAASLNRLQQILFNFGQQPFLFPPINYEFESFYPNLPMSSLTANDKQLCSVCRVNLAYN